MDPQDKIGPDHSYPWLSMDAETIRRFFRRLVHSLSLALAAFPSRPPSLFPLHAFFSPLARFAFRFSPLPPASPRFIVKMFSLRTAQPAQVSIYTCPISGWLRIVFSWLFPIFLLPDRNWNTTGSIFFFSLPPHSIFSPRALQFWCTSNSHTSSISFFPWNYHPDMSLFHVISQPFSSFANLHHDSLSSVALRWQLPPSAPPWQQDVCRTYLLRMAGFRWIVWLTREF